jgi:alkyl hydroperoxide reductase subunit F
MYDLIILGGGPAGLTAAMYAIRKRLDVLLVSKNLGGKTNYRLALPWIEDYQVIRGLEVVSKFRNELEYLDFAHKLEPVEEVCRQSDGFVVRTKMQELPARAVIVATGAKQDFLNVPGEKDFIMRGLCYSALSYAPLFIDRTAVVVGDGDLALRSTAELALIAKRVYLIWMDEHIGDSPLETKLVEAGNVEVMEGYRVREIHGDQYARSMLLDNPDGETASIEADGFFIEKALLPNSAMVKELVALDEAGRIQIDCSNHTNVPGIFAAGDVTTSHAEQVLISVGEGAKAALSAYDYLLPFL